MLMILNTYNVHVWMFAYRKSSKHLSRLQLTLMTNFPKFQNAIMCKFLFSQIKTNTHVCIAEILLLIIAKMGSNLI